MILFAVQSFSTFGNVLVYEPKQAVIQSLCKFEVTWSEASYYEISWWQSSLREHKKKSDKKLWTLFITRFNKQFAGKEKWVFNIC